jgi:hypothetical protein
LRSFNDSRNAALLAANQPSGARMKTVTVLLMLFVGLVVSSKSAPNDAASKERIEDEFDWPSNVTNL